MTIATTFVFSYKIFETAYLEICVVMTTYISIFFAGLRNSPIKFYNEWLSESFLKKEQQTVEYSTFIILVWIVS